MTEATLLDTLDGLIAKARAAGADAADAVAVESVSLSHACRLGAPEHVERSESADLGLRVFVGQRQAIVSSSDQSADAITELVERAVAMARAVPEDSYIGLAAPELLAGEIADLDMCDAVEPTAETLVRLTAEAEDSARQVPGITNSEGAEASWSRTVFAMAASNGFAQSYASSRHSLSVSVIAGEGTNMERDYDYATTVHAGDLDDPAQLGLSAGEKAVARLNPRKVETAAVPVVYDPRVSGSILGHLSSAINGASVARGTSFLKDKLGETIFPTAVRIVDDPLRRRGLRSHPFDGEGVGVAKRNIVEDGRLTTWILDLRSSRQLDMTTTGHASRGISSPPSPSASNLYMEPGAVSPENLIADIKSGFYISELIGFGVDGITGDYSRGASGMWIENGELAYPVSEVTIAGNLNDMFANLAAADDLNFRYGTNAPTLRIEGMTVAGV